MQPARPRDPFLFRPVQFRQVTARNRIIVSPMCQYCAQDGLADDWHLVHLGARATGGAGIVFVEATHVEPAGRITPWCLGLWNQEQADRLARIAAFVSAQGAVPAIQLAHSGRKGSVDVPWRGNLPLEPDQGAWQVMGPSPLAFGPGYPVPHEMDQADIDRVRACFVQSTRLALEAGFRILELHAAHGYLVSSFLSPLSNQRTDSYGGDLAGRTRLLLELVADARTVWPEHLPLFVRLTCNEWTPGGLTPDDAVQIARKLRDTGQVDLIDCSSGGGSPQQDLQPFPGYQLPFAARIRREANIPAGAVGLMHTPELAEAALASGEADVILIARGFLDDPNWPLHAAARLGRTDWPWPDSYARGKSIHPPF